MVSRLKVAHGLERHLARFQLKFCTLMLAILKYAWMASIFFTDRLQLTPFTSTKKLTEGLGDTGFSNFSISGKRHPTILLSRIDVAISNVILVNTIGWDLVLR